MNKRVVAVAGAVVLALAGTYRLSSTGIENIQKEEGTVQKAYLDSVGIPTICTGSTSKVKLGQVAKPGECEARLRTDTSVAGAAVGRLVKVPITQRQYDALVSLTFNIGEGNFQRSTLLKRINAGNCLGAGAQFDMWVYGGGKRLPGLVSRRARERAEWESGC